jgi:hypothetical protein
LRAGRFRGDLSLLAQGFEVAVTLGVRSLEGLVRVAELLEHSVYEPHSLTKTPNGLSFVLRNPPLRMGAFSAVRLFCNGTAIPAGNVSLAPGRGNPVGLDRVDREHPVTLPVGERTVFTVRGGFPEKGRIAIRLELQSVAIPPLVWFEFSDELRPAIGVS